MKTETIAAISTAMSNAGISIVRMSGDDVFSIIDQIFVTRTGKKKAFSEVESHTIHYGYIKDENDVIDEVLVMVMKAPNTYTRENIIEIDCHGGVIVTKKILETVIKYGARPAEPGEFTKRAFLNGRIDLSQAEAVIDIINAKNEMALKSSVSQLKGTVLTKIKEIRENIIRDVAFIEAALDDPEHISIDGFSDELLKRVEENWKELNHLLESADNGRIMKEGIRTVILGKPNAGKSSLLNVLVGEERAIVTEIEGTTRDTLEESIHLGEVVLNLIDTAGIRKTEDYVEKIGVDKAKTFAKDADLLIYVVDASVELDENDREIIDLIKDKKAIVLLNKTDLNKVVKKDELEKLTGKTVLEISAKEEKGMDLLEHTIKEMFFHGEISFNDEVYITNIRHKSAIIEGMKSLEQVKESILNGMPEDFYSIDLMSAYETLGEIIGEAVGEDLVNTIFSEFCMGK
ncbi:tRNA uridine-5-carboxymethylaminomethyl(34) synthesis GTPase MnmE [Velocimicrobium porci]|uniref:tRNA modification GTPase MnmE n=1 Tax=Velocimicrobium porci TaxID=2606634 RepID=A0A6L5XVW3_9FIRM|nr:tRNA uridine-5-carboxymethylaminomethyl(34) synthesis GTPase MnmE [Velocimicrobium porci]MSS62960.1 tRNA uridine-5-carboxymethylaminomethyl(34) synthesis GTPase MnmE [Velocimicrobium porci]